MGQGKMIAMNLYHLYVKVKGHLEWVCQIEAADHAEALRKAVGCLTPDHHDKSIRLEQEDGFRVEGPH